AALDRLEPLVEQIDRMVELWLPLVLVLDRDSVIANQEQAPLAPPALAHDGQDAGGSARPQHGVARAAQRVGCPPHRMLTARRREANCKPCLATTEACEPRGGQRTK